MTSPVPSVQISIPNPTVTPTVTVNWATGATAVSLPNPVVNIPIGVGVPGKDGNSTIVPPVVQTLTAQASVSVTHPFAYIPRVTLTDPTGAEVDSDVAHTAGHVALTFAQPFTGTVTIS